MPISTTRTTFPSSSSTSPGLIERSIIRITPETKFSAMFCIAKPKATAKIAPAASRVWTSIPRWPMAIRRPTTITV